MVLLIVQVSILVFAILSFWCLTRAPSRRARELYTESEFGNARQRMEVLFERD